MPYCKANLPVPGLLPVLTGDLGVVTGVVGGDEIIAVIKETSMRGFRISQVNKAPDSSIMSMKLGHVSWVANLAVK